jgi:adenylosuccinate lyase
MLICPLDYRYGREAMKKVLSEENRLRTQLMVEAALARAHAKAGNIPKKDADRIAKACTLNVVKLSRVKEIEAETKHDVMAMVRPSPRREGRGSTFIWGRRQ